MPAHKRGRPPTRPSTRSTNPPACCRVPHQMRKQQSFTSVAFAAYTSNHDSKRPTNGQHATHRNGSRGVGPTRNGRSSNGSRASVSHFRSQNGIPTATRATCPATPREREGGSAGGRYIGHFIERALRRAGHRLHRPRISWRWVISRQGSKPPLPRQPARSSKARDEENPGLRGLQCGLVAMRVSRLGSSDRVYGARADSLNRLGVAPGVVGDWRVPEPFGEPVAGWPCDGHQAT
jgi:hypothetical protein